MAETATAHRRIADELLGDAAGLSDKIVAAASALPGYPLDPASVAPTNRAAIPVLIGWLLVDAEAPTATEVAAVANRLFELRLELGLDLEMMLQVVQVSASVVWSAMVETAERLELSPSALVEPAARLFAVMNNVTAAGAEMFRRLEADRSRLDEHARAGALRDLLLGRVPDAEMAARATQLEVAVDGLFTPFRARRSLTADWTAVAVTTVIDGDLAGIATTPIVVSDDSTVGIAPAVSLAELPGSFALATRALETAVAFGLRGAHTIDSLLPLPGIVADVQVGDRLVARYLAPLDALGPFGDVLLDTLRAFFANGMRPEATARALFVHPNTLRYRFRRFEAVTGADLRSTDALVSVWWALRRREATNASEGRPTA